MEKINEKLQSDLIKNGIFDKNENLNPKIDKADFENLMNGGELLIENDNKAMLISINESSLKIQKLNNDFVKHSNLSSAEIYHLLKNKNMAKTLADYGKIVDFGKDHFQGDIKNEKTFYVVLENDRGKTLFTGNDLENKLSQFKIGDNIQINNIGINKKNFEIDINGKVERNFKYDNVFNVEVFNSKNKQVKNLLFEFDKRTNTIKETDTTNFSIKSVNGHYLSEADINKLKKGKSISFDDGLEIKISPKSNNRFNLAANSKNLLIGSLLIDGGLSFMIIKTIQVIKESLEENKRKQIENKYINELNKLKSQLLQQAQKFPADKSIIANINIVDKEIQSVNSINKGDNKKAGYTETRIDMSHPFENSQEIQHLAEKYKDKTLEDLIKMKKDKNDEYWQNLQADNHSTMKEISKDINEIDKVIKYKEENTDNKEERRIKLSR